MCLAAYFCMKQACSCLETWAALWEQQVWWALTFRVSGGFGHQGSFAICQGPIHTKPWDIMLAGWAHHHSRSHVTSALSSP